MVTEKDAKDYKEQMSKPDLVFLTPENKEKVGKRISPDVKAEIEKQEREKANAIKQSEQPADSVHTG